MTGYGQVALSLGDGTLSVEVRTLNSKFLDLSLRLPKKYSEKTQTLTIGKRQGEFPGMLRERTFQIIRVSPDKMTGLDFTLEPDKMVKYDGKELTIKIK